MLRSKIALAVLPLVLALASVGCGGAPGEAYDEQGQPLATREHVVAAASEADEVMGVREALLEKEPKPVGANAQITDSVTSRAPARVFVNEQITDSVTQ